MLRLKHYVFHTQDTRYKKLYLTSVCYQKLLVAMHDLECPLQDHSTLAVVAGTTIVTIHNLECPLQDHSTLAVVAGTTIVTIHNLECPL